MSHYVMLLTAYLHMCNGCIFFSLQLEEHVAELGKDPDNKKIKDLFKEAASCLELVNGDEMAALAEMFD